MLHSENKIEKELHFQFSFASSDELHDSLQSFMQHENVFLRLTCNEGIIPRQTKGLTKEQREKTPRPSVQRIRVLFPPRILMRNHVMSNHDEHQRYVTWRYQITIATFKHILKWLKQELIFKMIIVMCMSQHSEYSNKVTRYKRLKCNI